MKASVWKLVPPWMVETEALSPDVKEERSEAWVPETDLGIQMQKPYLPQLTAEHTQIL